MVEQDLIAIIFSEPWIYLVIIVGIIGFVLIKYMGKPKRPETEAFYGMKVRRKMTKEQMTNRNKVWGEKINFTLYKGFQKIGKAINVETIIRNNPSKNHTYYNISFRKYGLIPYLKALLGMFEYLIIDPQAINFSEKEKAIRINPNVFLLDDSGIWSIASKKELEFIDELNIKKDVENVKGFTSDFLRRLSNEAPAQAMITERMTHEANLEEQKRSNRISRFVS